MMGIFFRSLVCFLKGVVGAICLRSIEMLLWNLWNLEQTCSQILPTSEEHRTNGAPGEAKIGPRGTPKSFRQTGRTKKHATPLKYLTNGSKMGPPNRKVCSIINDLFEDSPESVLICFFDVFFDSSLDSFHDLFACLRVSFLNHRIWLKVYRANTEYAFWGFGT